MKYAIFILFFFIISSYPLSGQPNFTLVQFDTQDKGKIEASLFESGKDKVVLFAHGGIFNKESWYFLAEQFQERGVSSLSIDFRGYGNSEAGNMDGKFYDILGAITYLRDNKYKDIVVIGGSMGGAAVLNALDQLDVPVQSVALLAPAGGPALKTKATEKLFIVSEGDRFYSRVRALYEGSSRPKSMEIYTGDAHAQHLFKSEHSMKIQTLLLDFVLGG